MDRATPRAPSTLALLACGALACACTTRSEPVVPVIDVASVRLAYDPDGPWRDSGVEAPPPSALRGAVRGAADAPAPPGAPARASPPPATIAAQDARPASAALPVPAERGLGQVAPAGARPRKSLEQEARERFLDHPTEIVAENITLYAPAAILAEGRLTAEALTQPGAGKRAGTGDARLALRELTLRADRITLRERPGSPDVQIMARGAVQFVSRQRDSVVRERDLQGLILTNDQMTPLR